MIPKQQQALFNWLIILTVGWAHKRVDGLVMRALDGPTVSVTRGTDIILHCRYELEPGDRLYAVKWFRGQREFYRFRPDVEPPARLFPVDGVQVDIESSNDEKVVIRHVVPGTSGVYRCEVSAEGTFETDFREINITITDTPIGDPVIYNIQSRYAVGDQLDINCTCFESKPAARLQWYLNGNLKDDDDVIRYPSRWTAPTARHPTFLETSTLGLKIRQLRPDHFIDGALFIVCRADLMATDRIHRSTSVKALLIPSTLPARQQPQPVHPWTDSWPAILFPPDKRRSAHHNLSGGGGRSHGDGSTLIFFLLPLFLRVLSSL